MKFYIAILAILLCKAMFADTIPGGAVSGTWTVSGSPYYIQGMTYVPEGQTLTIEAGVSAIWLASYTMYIEGRILAMGTEPDSILFTAADTAAGFRSIRFINTPLQNDTSVFTYCIFRYSKVFDPWPENCGGAIGCINFGKIIIDHCLFEYNYAIVENEGDPGGGAIALWNSSPLIWNSTFRKNGSYAGGAIFCYENSLPIIKNNVFFENEAVYGGAVMCYIESHPEISDNRFYENTADYGGAMDVVDHCHPVIHHNLIKNNTGYVNGGAMSLYGFCSPGLVNNTIVSNMADSTGGGIAMGNFCSPVIRNNILWGNSSYEGSQVYIDAEYCFPEFYYSDIEDGENGIGGEGSPAAFENCIDDDPLFEDFMNFYLVEGSPCIDEGDPDEAYYDNEDPLNPGYALWPAMGSVINDMGTYGGPFQGTVVSVEEMPFPGLNITSGIDLQCFPNPADDYLTLSVGFLPAIDKCNLDFSIYDIGGRVVMQMSEKEITPCHYLLRLDVSGLNAGIYIVRWEAGDLVAFKKIILK